MADKRSQLDIGVSTSGADGAAKDLNKVADAQAQVENKVESAGKSATEAAEGTKKLAASESDYTEVLRRINPVLGNVVDSAIKASRVIGDLATQEINLGEIGGKLTEAIKANAGALKLLAAGGAAALAIYAVVTAVQKMREEFEQATKAIKAQMDALTALRQEQRQEQADLEALADARREGGYGTAEEAQTAAQRLQRVQEQAPFIEKGAAARAVALSGAETATGELARRALMLQTGRVEVTAEMPADMRERRFERALQRHAEVIEKTFTREWQQGPELFMEARRQMREQIGGSRDALMEIVRRATKGEGVDAARIAAMLQALPDLREYMAQQGGAVPGTMGEAIAKTLEHMGVPIEGGEATTQEVEIVARLETLINAQADVARQFDRAAERMATAVEKVGAQPTVVNQYHHARFIGADTNSRNGRIWNGEKAAKQWSRP